MHWSLKPYMAAMLRTCTGDAQVRCEGLKVQDLTGHYYLRQHKQEAAQLCQRKQ